jgi:hypothetical protein
MAVDVRDDVPAVGFEALRRVVGEPAFDVAVDRDAVVVPEGDQLAEAEGAGQRAGFVRDAFHQAAVAEEHVGVVIDDLVAGLVELGGQHLFGQREADGVGDALAERAGGGFDAGRVAEFRVARGLASATGGNSSGRRSTGRSRSGAAARRSASSRGRSTARSGRGRPVRVGRVVAQVAAPEHFGDFRHAHRGRAGVAGVGLLHGVHGQGADGAGLLTQPLPKMAAARTRASVRDCMTKFLQGLCGLFCGEIRCDGSQ